MNVFAIIKIVVGAVQAVEQLLPQSKGKEKLDAAIAVVTEVVGDVVPILPALEKLIETIVKGFNALGIFKKQ